MYVEGPGPDPLPRRRHGQGVPGRPGRRTAAAHPGRPGREAPAGLRRHGSRPCTRATRSPSRRCDGIAGRRPRTSPARWTHDTNKVGMVLRPPPPATRTQHYVVLPGKVAPVSDFIAKLLLSSRDLDELGQAGQAQPVGAPAFSPGRGLRRRSRTGRPRGEGRSTPPDVTQGSREHRVQRPARRRRRQRAPPPSPPGWVRASRRAPHRLLQRLRHPRIRPALPPVPGHADRCRLPLPGHRHRTALRHAVQQRQRQRRLRHRRVRLEEGAGGAGRRPSRPRTSSATRTSTPPRTGGLVEFLPTGPRLSTTRRASRRVREEAPMTQTEAPSDGAPASYATQRHLALDGTAAATGVLAASRLPAPRSARGATAAAASARSGEEAVPRAAPGRCSASSSTSSGARPQGRASAWRSSTPAWT